MSEQDQDRSEQATPFKLQEAKRRGQVAKSLDINSFFLIAGALVIAWLSGERMIVDGLRISKSILGHAANLDFRVPSLVGWFTDIALAAGSMLAPLFVVMVILGILSNMAQTGPIFSMFPLKPDPKRLNPIQGFKRVFSATTLFQALKTFAKLGLFAAVAYGVITGLLPVIFRLIDVDPRAYPTLLLDQVLTLIFKLLVAVLVVAVLDLLYTRWDFGKKMRMSRRELKDEVKRREGDPQVRAKIKELQREAAKRSKSLHRVPEADVLITNPTHYAVALKYRQGAGSAPRVIAKGAGETALSMRRMAQRHGVPVQERRALAQQLFRDIDIDQPIPLNLYEPIARLYAELYASRGIAVRGEVTT